MKNGVGGEIWELLWVKISVKYVSSVGRHTWIIRNLSGPCLLGIAAGYISGGCASAEAAFRSPLSVAAFASIGATT